MPDKALIETRSITESQLPSYFRGRTPRIVTYSNNETPKESIKYVAGEDINIGEAVYIHTDGKCYKADAIAAQLICLSSVATNSIARLSDYGVLKISGKNFTIGEPIFLSSNGSLTQTIPLANYSQELGIAVSPDEILIQIKNFYIFE